ncbi:MAG: hypothetical protein PUC41_09640 [Oscillospiraceae bacterium]|nr:hypothetical protein [Oscillospiraceae bacterium]
MEQMHPQQHDDQLAAHWTAFYRTGSVKEYLQYRNCARQEEYPYASYRQGVGDTGDCLRRKRQDR